MFLSTIWGPTLQIFTQYYLTWDFVRIWIIFHVQIKHDIMKEKNIVFENLNIFILIIGVIIKNI